MKSFLFALLAVVSVAVSAYCQAGYGAWRTLAPMPSARQEVSTAYYLDRIFVISGFTSSGASTNTVEAYDPAMNTWSSIAPIPILNNHNNSAVAGGALYTFGGVSNSLFRYNPGTNTWSTLAPSIYQHNNTAAVGVIDGKIYVAGGNGGGMQQNELEVYDPALNQWSPRASMSVPRNHTAGVVIDGKFYVVAGRGSTNAPTALEVYDPATNAWTTLAPMPTPRSGVAAAAVNGQLWVFGGEIPVLSPFIEIYNPKSNTWRRFPATMPTPRHGIWATVVGNKVYIPGGGIVQGLGATNINEVFTVANVEGDFDGDGRTDLSVFRPSNGTWYQGFASGGFTGFPWGIWTDKIVPGDYDGDGKTDAAVFRANSDGSQPDFYVLNSSNFSVSYYSWGLPNDISITEDYDGDARDDIAVYRQSNRTFYVLRSGDGSVQTFAGLPDGSPVAGDFDGDGKGDFTAIRFGGWTTARSSQNYQTEVIASTSVDDIAAPCDYFGDGTDGPSSFTPSTGEWRIRRFTGASTSIPWGVAGDVPTPGDYDGDGRCDVAIYRNGTWWVRQSAAGVSINQFGIAGDVPIPNRYLP